MTIKNILFLGILLSIIKVNAQIDFHNGYLIKENGDTLFGKVAYQKDSLMAKLCIFKNKGGDNIIYTPKDIIAYRFDKDKYFIRKKIDSQLFFLECLIQGSLSVYYLNDSLGSHYFLEKKDIGMTQYLYVEEKIPIIRFKRDMLVTRRSIYKMDSINLFQSHPEYQAKMAKMGYLNHRNMVRLAIKYNNMVSKYPDYVIYEKEMVNKNIILEPIVGVVNYYKIQDYKDINYFQKGLLVHFMLPSVDKRLYFRTGVLYSSLQQDLSNSKDIFKIPVQFEFNYNRRTINPEFGLGFNYYRPDYLSIALMAGFSIRLNSSVNLGLKYDVDFSNGEGFPLPKTLLSQSTIVGIEIRI